MSVNRYDVGTFDPPKRLDNGYLKTDGRITRVGVFQYRRQDGGVRNELRLPEEVFSKEALDSFAVSPLTNDHPPEGLNVNNTGRFQVGSATDVRRDEDHVAADLLITDARAINEIDAGKNQLSCGYKCDLEMKSGTTSGIEGVKDGLKFDAIQRNIRGNHVAIVRRGRAGESVRLRMDAADAMQVDHDDPAPTPEPKPEPKPMGMKKITVDGIDIEVPEQSAQIIEQSIAKRDESIVKSKGATTDLAKEKARADKAEEDLETEKKARTDAVDPENVQKLVTARVKLVQDAAAVLGGDKDKDKDKDYPKLDEMSDAEIKRAVVLKMSPQAEAKLDAAEGEAYLEARYDQAIESFEQIDKNRPNRGIARVKAIHSVRNDDEGADEAEKRRDAMIEYNIAVGREPLPTAKKFGNAS